MQRKALIIIFLAILIIACFYIIKQYKKSKLYEYKNEEISTLDPENEDTSFNSLEGNITFSKILSKPNNVILTGFAQHRLITIYRTNKLTSTDDVENSSSRYYTEYDENGNENEIAEHYVPGIQILYGYNLLNIAHFNMHTKKIHYFFNKPAFVKTLYYPSYTQDSINKIPVVRNYYLASAYDEDTNKDKLINKKDLRKFYYFNLDCDSNISLLPIHYSALRSQYDNKNDVLYIFAKYDSNKNGLIEREEPLKIFWLDLKNPVVANKLY